MARSRLVQVGWWGVQLKGRNNRSPSTHEMRLPQVKGARGQTSLSCTVLRVNLAWFPCKIILRLLSSSLGLAQDIELAESSPSSRAQKMCRE